MGDVTDFKKALRQREVEAIYQAMAVWQCTDCNGVEFYASQCGRLICKGCKDLMEDLQTYNPDTHHVEEGPEVHSDD